MAGNAGIPMEPILREHKVTLYKKHPTILGLVVKMPNLPFGLTERDLFLNKKGYKRDPQELAPKAKIETTPEGEIFLVPEGYELKAFDEKTTIPDKQNTVIDVVNYRVVEETTQQELACPQCGKVCKGEFGLSVHLKSHK